MALEGHVAVPGAVPPSSGETRLCIGPGALVVAFTGLHAGGRRDDLFHIGHDGHPEGRAFDASRVLDELVQLVCG